MQFAAFTPKRRRCFAHMVGTPHHLDPIVKERPLTGNPTLEVVAGTVQVSFRPDTALEPLQKALLSSAITTRKFFLWLGRIGPPRTDISCKFRWYQQAMDNPATAVLLDNNLQRVLAAKQAGLHESQNLAYRRKPKYRTREPGVKSILAFNAAFIAFLLYGSW